MNRTEWALLLALRLLWSGSILNATTPLFSVLLAHVVGRERATARRIGGVVLGVVGVAVLIGPAALRGIGGGVAGQVAVLASGVSYACAGLYGRRLLSLSPASASAGMLAGATLVLLPIVCVVERPWHATPGVTTIAALLALALISTAAGYVLYFRILATAGPTNLLLVTLLMPIGALALGAAMLHERPSPASLAGMALIFCGLAIIDGRPTMLGVIAPEDSWRYSWAYSRRNANAQDARHHSRYRPSPRCGGRPQAGSGIEAAHRDHSAR